MKLVLYIFFVDNKDFAFNIYIWSKCLNTLVTKFITLTCEQTYHYFTKQKVGTNNIQVLAKSFISHVSGQSKEKD